MRNYDFRPDLRPTADEDEPELQWLEDSINYLVAISIAIIGEFCKLVFGGVRGIFQLFVKTKI